MEETFSGKLIHAVAFLAICAAIIWIGWHEPLRYRFLTHEEIVEIEGPPPTPVPAPTPSQLLSGERSATRLNQGPGYKTRGRGEIYSLPHRKADGLEPPPETRTGR